MGAKPPPHPYESLTPDLILDAIESQGFDCDGRLLALNSYENRVYEVGLDDDHAIIVKFYRPGRWSRAALEEEMQFVAELSAEDLPVVAAIEDAAGTALREHDIFSFALYPRRGGRAPEFDREDALRTMGRYLARMHSVGARSSFVARDTLSVEVFGSESVRLITERFIPADLAPAYEAVAGQLLDRIEQCFDASRDIRLLRVHGDCHVGNVLWRDDAPHFVDFDDARMAPAVQDIWMLLSGYPEEQREQLHVILEAYESFRDFDYRELTLIEGLRTLRMLHYAAWLGRRWDDPAFPRAFPWFNTQAYWEQHVLELKEQLAAFDDPLIPERANLH